MSPAHRKLIFVSLFFPSLLLIVKIAQVNALTVDPVGKVIVERRGEVLSKSSDDNNDKDSSGSGGSGSSGSGSPQESRTTTTTQGGTTIETRQKEEETRTEVTLPSGTRVKTRQEPDRTRIDIYEGGTKLRLERRDDRTVIKMEDEKGEEVELPPGTENEIFKIEERADKGQIKVSAVQDEFVFSRENVGAATNFPLSVNLQTNELTVTTPTGERTVAVLPDQAVKSILAANVIDQVGGVRFTQDVEKVATQAGTTLEDVIKLTTTREGVLAYEVPGTKKEKLLGFINVDIPKNVVVSAETGELLETQQDLLSQVLDFLSF